MLSLYKALIVVLSISMLGFVVVRPIFLRFMAPRDYALRRNLWLTLTTAAFLIPNYWLFLLVAAMSILFVARRDSNPVAVYTFLLLALPPLGMNVPTFGIVNQLIYIDHLNFLALVLLLPIALGFFARGPVRPGGARGERRAGMLHADVLIWLYVLLQIVLLFPYGSITATGKRITLLGIGMLLPYYVLSRAVLTRESFREVMAAFLLAALILVPLAVFETMRGWPLYSGLEEHWSTIPYLGYLTRGTYLRAQVTAGHSIVLGYTFVVAFSFWLALKTHITPASWRWATVLSLSAGLIVTFARGPWVGAALAGMIFVSLGPDALRRSAKAVGLLLVLGLVGMISPWGNTIVDYLPFIGSVGSGTIEYRLTLAETSWRLILENPIFGSRTFIAYMEDLRQGEGIIDQVNAYASIALSYGMVGLGLFVAFFGTIIVSCFKSTRRISAFDPDFGLAGTALVAALISALVMLFAVNLYLSIGVLTWALAGMGVAYARVTEIAFDENDEIPVPPEGNVRMQARTEQRGSYRSV